MISSAISADLGRQEALRGSQEALATVTGIVDGTGSIGAAVGQVTHTRDRESTHIHTVHAYTQKYVLSSDLMLSFLPCLPVFGIPDREQAGLDVCVLLLHSHGKIICLIHNVRQCSCIP